MSRYRTRFHTRRLTVAAVAAVLGGGALPSTANALDLTVSNVEVTQAVQTPANSILLVAQRGMAIRATVGISLNSGEVAPNNVTGRAHVFRNGVEITPAGGLAPVPTIPFVEPAVPNRDNETHTLNFELPAPTGITATTDLDVRVDVTPVAGETVTTNNSGSANDLDVESRVTPRIFYVRINYRPNGRGFPLNALVRKGVGDMFVRGILPFNDSSANLYNPLPNFPNLNYDRDSNGDNQLNGNDRNRLLGSLATLRQVTVLFGVFPFLGFGGVPADSFIYGWLEGPVAGNGLGQVNGRAGFGNTEDERHQGSFGHEFTHNLGFNHINQTIVETGWDVGARLLNNPSGNAITSHVVPSSTFDVQVAGRLTSERWVSDSKYISLLGNAAFRSAPGGRAFAAGTTRRPTRRVAVIHGIFNEAGTRLIELEPVFRYPWHSEPVPTDTSGPFVAELRTTSGKTTRVPFNAIVGDDEEPGVHTKKGFFEVMVPVSGELSRLRIMSRDGRRTFGTLRRGRPPRVRIESVRPNTTLRGTRTVRWELSDLDSDRSALRAHVVFSDDGGRSFSPVVIDQTDRSARFNTRGLKAQRGKGVLRVIVSDGLNTRYHDVRGLTLDD